MTTASKFALFVVVLEKRPVPFKGGAADPMYLDVSIPAGETKRFEVAADRHAFAYVFEGTGKFSNTSEAENRCLVLFENGDEITVRAGDKGVRFLLVSGEPLREPVAWRGPIVMNSQPELRQAFKELEEGTFLKQERSNAQEDIYDRRRSLSATS